MEFQFRKYVLNEMLKALLSSINCPENKWDPSHYDWVQEYARTLIKDIECYE